MIITSRDIYLSRLKNAALVTLAVTTTLVVLAPSRWFSFYGWATILLVAVALFSYPLIDRLRAIGKNRGWALLFIVPGLAIALAQIGYWIAFFRFGPANPVPGVVREVFWINAGFAVPYASMALAALWLYMFASTARVDA